MAHTTGPLAYIDGRIDALDHRKPSGFICKDGTFYIGGLVALPYFCGDGTAEDNARRFVACWNALAGWETETVEKYCTDGQPGHPNLGQAFASLLSQRDELLESLRALVQWSEVIESLPGFSAKGALLDDIDDARAAIAAATGEPQ